MVWGNGAYVVHRQLERSIPGYRVVPCHPYWTLLPIMLRPLAGLQEADLIHTVPDYAIFFYKPGVPLVLDFQNYVIDRWMRPYSSLAQRIHYLTDLRLFIYLSVRRASALTACSRYLADLVEKEMQPELPVRVVYNGVDEQRFTPWHASKRDTKKVRVFFSGNLTLRKGVQWLPGIAERLGKHIDIHYTQGLRPIALNLSASNLRPVGAVPFEQMHAHYQKMDILLMPTVREGFGLAVAEAMACGLPVVASDCSAIPELVDDGKGGFLCPVGDVAAFAEKINILADSPDLRREMGEYNRAKVEQMFTLRQMVQAHRHVFEAALAQ